MKASFEKETPEEKKNSLLSKSINLDLFFLPKNKMNNVKSPFVILLVHLDKLKKKQWGHKKRTYNCQGTE